MIIPKRREAADAKVFSFFSEALTLQLSLLFWKPCEEKKTIRDDNNRQSRQSRVTEER